MFWNVKKFWSSVHLKYNYRNPQWTKAKPYNKVKRFVRFLLRKDFPPLPKNIVDVAEILQRDEWKKRLIYVAEEGIENEITVTNVIDEADFCHVIFHSDNFLKKIMEIDVSVATVDGTFKTVPWLKGSYQMLIFSVISFGKVFI